MQVRQPEQYKYPQKSKFQDKGREKTDIGGENITGNLAGDMTVVGIRTEHTYIRGERVK